jgi:RNA polymerase sigma-70 factor (ECF subfamily)
MQDAELIRRLRDRDPEALFYLYTEYRDRVFAVVRRVVRDEWDAEEVVQDVFWTVHRKIDLFREDAALWSWMYRIAVNASKMRVRKYKRAAVPMEDELLHDICSKADGQDRAFTRPDQQLMCKQIMGEVERYLEDVSEVNRQLYIDMEIDGLSKEEVAAQLDLTVPAVKTRLHRIRAGLREQLSGLYDRQAV